jgi:DNA polymerase-3 subunit beta
MQLKIDGAEFVRGLSLVASVAEKKSSMPMLGCVLIEATKEHLRLTGNDLEVGLTAECKAEVETEGKVAVPVKNLLDICKSLPKKASVEIKTMANNWVVVVSGACEFKMPGLSADDFAGLPSYKADGLFMVDGAKLLTMIRRTSYAISSDETRSNLNGALLEYQDVGGFRMVSTDGHRLGLVDQTLCAAKHGKLSFVSSIIPSKAIATITKLLESAPVDVRIGRQENNFVVTADGITFMARLIDGQFPTYEHVIPGEQKHTVRLNAEAFSGALKRISILASDKTCGIHLGFEKGKLVVSTQNPDLGEGREELEVEYDGDAIGVGFNATYLIEGLAGLACDEVDFSFDDELSPGVMRPAGRSEVLAVAMPMRL